MWNYNDDLFLLTSEFMPVNWLAFHNPGSWEILYGSCLRLGAIKSWRALSSFLWPMLLSLISDLRRLPWMNIMIAIPATAILLTNDLHFIALDFWEKIRAVCCRLVPEQCTALARCWYCFALILFAIILSWSNVTRCRRTIGHEKKVSDSRF